MPKVNFAGYKVNVPGHPLLRVVLGVLLIIGGFLGIPADSWLLDGSPGVGCALG